MADKRNFLVPVDFLPESEAALRYAVTVAKSIDADLHVMHILEEESPLLKAILKDEQREMIWRGAQDKLDKLAAEKAGPDNLAITTHIRQGKVYDKIVETASEIKADVIFMGRTDSSNMKKNMTGTNTLHIIRDSRIPVITLRKFPKKPGNSNIIVPLDLTKQTKIQISNAVDIARMFKARITVLSIVPKKSKSLEIKFLQKLDKIRTILQKFELECEIKLYPHTKENLYGLLNKTVDKLEGNLLMIMTQQELNITEYFIGSQAQEIINKSEFPVLSLNPEAGESFGIPDPLAEVFIDPIQILDH